MGKPMKSRILGIVLALSLLAMVFPAVSTHAAVYYTGSVVTTDNAGTAKDLFFRGDPVYVNVELKQDGIPYSGSIRVELQRTTDGAVVSSFTATTNNPDVGWYNSSGTGWSLSTWSWFDGDLMTYDVVVYYTGGGWSDEIARQPIVVKMVDLWLDPEDGPYYPGEQVTINFVTTHTTEVFYVQVVDSSFATLVNWTGQVALEGWWSTVWTIPSDFPDGAFQLHVREAGTNSSWDHVHFDVQKYVLMISPDRDNFLPGETAKITYAVYDTASMTPYVGVTITYSASWQNSSGNWTWQNDTLSGTEGTQEFVIASDIAWYSDVEILYWANESDERSYDSTVWLYIAELSADVTVNDGPYMPGDMVVIDVDAWIGGDAMPGAAVDIQVIWNGSAIVAYGAVGLSTDLAGQAIHTFKLVSNAVVGTYLVNATISKAGVTVNRMGNFMVEWDGDMIVTFDKAYYNSGDNILAKFRTVWNNEEVTGYAIAFVVYTSMGILRTGNTNGTEATIAIPADYSGVVSVMAAVNINGWILEGSANVNVNFASVVLTAANAYYRSGEAVTFNYEIITTLENATLEWEITDADDVRVATGTPAFASEGAFSYDVPDMNPSESYTAELIVKNPAGGYITADATVWIIAEYELMVWAGKSSYSSGEFAPGQTVKLHYAINSYVYEHLSVYGLVVYTSWNPSSMTFQVTEATGTIDIEIPDDAPTGDMGIQVWLYDPIADDDLDSDFTTVAVNNKLSAWDKSLGGMSAIDMLLLILIVLLMLLLIIVPFLKGRMGGEKAAPAAPPMTPPPPSP
jgi:hypothetical protein